MYQLYTYDGKPEYEQFSEQHYNKRLEATLNDWPIVAVCRSIEEAIAAYPERIIEDLSTGQYLVAVHPVNGIAIRDWWMQDIVAGTVNQKAIAA